MTKDQRWLLEEKYGGDESAPGYKEDLTRLAAGEPVAYVIGSQPFLGLTIYLDSKPLIPRPETEWWTEQLADNILKSQLLSEEEKGVGLGLAARSAPFSASERTLSILDLCAGSGAIGCALLARIPNARVSFGEIDPAHKLTIEKNLEENNLDASLARIAIGDLFAPFVSEKFDIIAANPPYIPDNRTLEKSVGDYEPSLALFSENDGLGLIRRIARELPAHLTEHGQAWIECDRDNVVEAKALFEAAPMRAEIRNDQFGVPRILVVSFL